MLFHHQTWPVREPSWALNADRHMPGRSPQDARNFRSFSTAFGMLRLLSSSATIQAIPSHSKLAERPSKAAFYHCRYCCRWKVLGDFSSEQLLWADAVLPGRGRASRDGRGHRADPVCRSCAHFALSLENTSTALEEGQRSVSREVRYAPGTSLEILGHPAIRRRFEGAMSLVSELL